MRNATELLIQHQTAIITSLTKEIEAGKRGSRREARLVLAKIHFKFLVALICTVAMSILTQTTFAQGPTSQDVDRASLLQNQTQPPFGTSTSSEGIEDGHAASSPNDADIGEQEILKRTTEYRPLFVSLAAVHPHLRSPFRAFARAAMPCHSQRLSALPALQNQADGMRGRGTPTSPCWGRPTQSSLGRGISTPRRR